MSLDVLELEALQLELRLLRLEIPTDNRSATKRTQKLREPTLRVADMRRACWGD